MNRREFIIGSAFSLGGCASIKKVITPSNKVQESATMIGSLSGFAPQVGVLVSMLNYVRFQSEITIRDISIQKLDYLHDAKANRIGALLLHVAAIEYYYQTTTLPLFAGSYTGLEKSDLEIAMDLGDKSREVVINKPITYYLDFMKSVRDTTISSFKKLDDKWLMTVDHGASFGATNNYCKWFHVCEHESNHFGQIKWLLSRA